MLVIKGLSAAWLASSAALPLAEWQGKRLQFGRCGGLWGKALLAPDCCSQPQGNGGKGKRTEALTKAYTRPPLREKAQRLGVPIYFKNTKNTASTRQAKAAMWFHWMGWPLKTNITMMVKTVREITSWITLS